MSLFSKFKEIKPVVTIDVDMEKFTLDTHTKVPGLGEYGHSTDLTPVYELFLNKLIDDGWLEAEE